MLEREPCLSSTNLHMCGSCIEASLQRLIRIPLPLLGLATNLMSPQCFSTSTRVPLFQVPDRTQHSANQRNPSDGKLPHLPYPASLPSRRGGVEVQQSGFHSRGQGNPIRPPLSADSQSFHRTVLPVNRFVGFPLMGSELVYKFPHE